MDHSAQVDQKKAPRSRDKVWLFVVHAISTKKVSTLHTARCTRAFTRRTELVLEVAALSRGVVPDLMRGEVSDRIMAGVAQELCDPGHSGSQRVLTGHNGSQTYRKPT